MVLEMHNIYVILYIMMLHEFKKYSKDVYHKEY